MVPPDKLLRAGCRTESLHELPWSRTTGGPFRWLKRNRQFFDAYGTSETSAAGEFPLPIAPLFAALALPADNAFRRAAFLPRQQDVVRVCDSEFEFLATGNVGNLRNK